MWEEGVREQERWDRMKTTMVPCAMSSLCIVMLYCLLCVAHVYYMNVLLPVQFSFLVLVLSFLFFLKLDELMKSPPIFVRVYQTSHVIFLDVSG